MAALIEGQNEALREVVMQTAALLRAQAPGARSKSTEAGLPQLVAASPHARVIPWGWISAAMLMGMATTVALARIAHTVGAPPDTVAKV